MPPKSTKTLIDDQLRTAIRESGLTHYRIAKAAGITPDQVARFVAGERELRSSAFAAIAEALGMKLIPRWLSLTFPLCQIGDKKIVLLFSNGSRLLRFLEGIRGSEGEERKPARLMNDDLREHLRHWRRSGGTHVAFDFDHARGTADIYGIQKVIDAIKDPEVFDPSILGKPTVVRIRK